MNGKTNGKNLTKADLRTKSVNKVRYYQAMSKKQLITEYAIDDLNHLYRPFGSEK